MDKKRSVAFHTLGCKLNFSETSTITRVMEQGGFEKKDFFEDLADVYVINTCSVTDNADKECRMLVRRIQRKAPEAMVVITGCYAQLKPAEIAAIPGVTVRDLGRVRCGIVSFTIEGATANNDTSPASATPAPAAGS